MGDSVRSLPSRVTETWRESIALRLNTPLWIRQRVDRRHLDVGETPRTAEKPHLSPIAGSETPVSEVADVQPRRCQAMTGSGVTMTSAVRQ